MVSRPLRSTLFATVLLLAGFVDGAIAQDGVLRGIVKDSTGAAIADADVAIVALHKLTRTDARGGFSFDRMPRGEHEVSVRRLGYQPTTVKTTVGDLVLSFEIVMPSQATAVAGVTVDAAAARLRLGIEEFYRRRASGMGGQYFTRQEILARNAHRTTDVLRNTSGVRIVGRGVRFTGSGTGARGCIPTLWLDGQAVQGMELDNIPVTDIEGMELYSGPSETPLQFSHHASRTDCGTIVVWTRIPGKG